MSEMLDRAARAMFDDEMAHTTIIETRNGQPIPKTPEWIEEQWAQTRLAWRRRARTMLTAMREPTKEMAFKGGMAITASGDYRVDGNKHVENGTVFWRAMLDAALN